MKINNSLLILSIIILLILFGILVFTIVSDSGKCIKDPLVYSVEKIENVEDGELRCNCNIYKEGEIKTFYFDNNGISNEPLNKGSLNIVLNN